MASSRKKQDEKNLKTLRELGALTANKYCFDCNQRGPTYVDVTIGSFVCTKCSGMLRGLTPPHRVKSISMATFTTEEIELLKNRGNDYCKSVWLGLYEGTTLPPSDCRDEQSIRDFMVEKYERKRYYLDPAQALRNGYTIKNESTAAVTTNGIKPLTNLISDPKPIRLNGTSNTSGLVDSSRKRPEIINKVYNKGFITSNNLNDKTNNEFVANFDKADIFSSNNNNHQQQQQYHHNSGISTESFANFDDNPVFNNNMNSVDEFSIFDLKFTNSGPVLNQVPLFPKCNTNRWSMPGTFDNLNVTQANPVNKVPAPPPEDKYAALKDLDNALKSQNALDWNSSGSTGSLYSSSTPTGSMYSSPSPQSVFGSPSQGQFMSAFQAPQENNVFSNPFNTTGGNGLQWGNTNGFGNSQPLANPFRDPIKSNGFALNFQPAVFPCVTNGTTWGPNPFKVGGSNMNSNNPFL